MPWGRRRVYLLFLSNKILMDDLKRRTVSLRNNFRLFKLYRHSFIKFPHPSTPLRVQLPEWSRRVQLFM